MGHKSVDRSKDNERWELVIQVGNTMKSEDYVFSITLNGVKSLT